MASTWATLGEVMKVGLGLVVPLTKPLRAWSSTSAQYATYLAWAAAGAGGAGSIN